MAKQQSLFAGVGAGQAKPQTHVWLTPRWILDELGPFDLDPCAAPGWPTAANHLFEADNGLSHAWDGRVWLNPPYDRYAIGEWMWRLAEHDCGTALTFARTDTAWFFRSVWDHARALLFLDRRIHFHKPNGVRADRNGGAPSVLIAYGRSDCERLASSDIRGAFVLLQNQHWAVVAIPRTWAQLVAQVVAGRGAMSLGEIYAAIDGHPKTGRNQHWRAKIRQIVQRPPFRRLRPGVYSLENEDG